MLLIYAVVIGVTALGSISFALMDPYADSGFSDFMIVMLILLYGLSIFALLVVTYVYMCLHFYKTMYSDQGYLTHTLPVTPMATFHVKLITSFVWTFLSAILLFLSLVLLSIGATHGEILTTFQTEFLVEFNKVFAPMGITLGSFVVLAIISLILSCFSYLLWVFASTSIGQLFHQYKIVASIVAGIVIYFIQQIVSSAFTFILGMHSFEIIDASTSDPKVMSAFCTQLTWSVFGLTAVFIIIFYVICSVIVRKHINLD